MPFDSNGNWIPYDHTPLSKRVRTKSPDEIARRKSGNTLDSLIQQQQAQQDFPSLEANSMQGVTTPPPLPDGGSSLGDSFANAQNNILDFLGRAEVQGANTRAFDLFNIPTFQNFVQNNDTVPNFIKDAFRPAQTTSEKAADITGQVAGFALGNPADAAGLTMKAGESLAGKIAPNAPGWLQSAIKGAGGVASYELPYQALEAGLDTQNNGQQSLGQRAEDFAINTGIGAGLGLAGHGLGALLERLRKPEVTAPPTDLVPYQPPGTLDTIPPEGPRQAEFLRRIPREIPEQDYFPGTSAPILPEGRLPIEGVPDRPQLNSGGKDFFFPRPWDEPTQTRDFSTPPEPVTPDIPQPKQLENPNKATGYLADPLQQRYDAEMERAIDVEFNRLKQIRNKPPGYLDKGNVMRDLSPYQGGEVIGRTKTTSGNPQWYRDFYAENGRKPNNAELRQIARDHVLNGEKDSQFGDLPSTKPMKPDELEKEILKISNQLSKETNPANIEYLANRLDELGNQYNRLTADPHYIAPEAKANYIPKDVEPVRYKVNDNSFQRPRKELPFSIPQAKARFHADIPEVVPRKADPRTNIDELLNGLKKKEQPKVSDKIISAIERVEQAAKDRIKSRGNRLNSLPLDQLGDYAIVGAAKLAKGAVKFADWSAEMIRDFGKTIEPHLKKVYEEAHKMNGTKPQYEVPKKTKEPTVNQRMKAEAADTLKGLEPDTWKDKSMVGLKRETMERNFEDIMGSDSGVMKAEYIEPIKKGEAERIKFLNQQRGYVKNLYNRYKAKDKSKFDQLVQMYGEGVENGGISLDQLKEKAPNQWKDIKDAAEKMRSNYDYLIQEANKVLEENGFKPIPYRNNYFPHFESIDNFLSSIGIKIQNHSLPTDINGITHTFKPGKPFFRNALRRIGIETDYGAMEGFDRYVEGISNVIYHTENIKKLRALEDTIRNKYKNETHLANFVSELNDYTNILSGKKALIDRAVGDGWLGRSVYNVMDNLKRRTGANIVGANLASAMTNFIPLTQAAATTGKQAFAKAMMQSLGNVMKDDGFIQQSDFLIKRIGSDPLHRNLWDKAVDKSMWMMKTFDGFVSQSIVRAKYNELVDKGLSHEAAIHQADNWAGKVMGARSKGEVPTILANKTLGALTQFQLEVNNQVSFLLKDMPREYGKNKATLAAAYAQVFLYGYLFNEGYEKLVGRRPALDPIGVTIKAIEDFNNPYMEKKNAAKNLTKNITDQIPFASVLTNGGRIPLLAGIPDVLGIIDGSKSIKDEIIKPAVYLTLPAGGSQIKKTVQGTNAMNDLGTQKTTGVYDENTKGEKYLKYPVENSTMNNIRGPLFGPSSFPETQNYYDNARRSLSVGQTKQIERSKTPNQTYDRMMKDRRIETLLDNIKDVQRDKKLSSTEKKVKITDIRKLLDDVKKAK